MAATANNNHPTMSSAPPSGVTGPSHRHFSRQRPYKLPENKMVPSRKHHAAADALRDGAVDITHAAANRAKAWYI